MWICASPTRTSMWKCRLVEPWIAMQLLTSRLFLPREALPAVASPHPCACPCLLLVAT